MTYTDATHAIESDCQIDSRWKVRRRAKMTRSKVTSKPIYRVRFLTVVYIALQNENVTRIRGRGFSFHNPIQPNPSFNPSNLSPPTEYLQLITQPIPNKNFWTQPNPWVNPTHGHVWLTTRANGGRLGRKSTQSTHKSCGRGSHSRWQPPQFIMVIDHRSRWHLIDRRRRCLGNSGASFYMVSIGSEPIQLPHTSWRHVKSRPS